MSDPHFFGYGSLVNTATHDYPDPRQATLPGWRRVWRFTPARPVAYLSVEPCPNCEIAGLIARVPGGDWAALDEREAAYERRDVSDVVRTGASSGPVAVYHVAGSGNAVIGEHAILLSYLDVVVQGYLRQFGPDGAEAFFATTRGWSAPILNDRAAPLYPRHQTLLPRETEMVDRLLDIFRGQETGRGS